MYELIAIEEAVATRFLKLKNLNSNMIEECFDDSELISDEDNFSFMKVGRIYDCKIKLFGNYVEKKTNDSVTCEIISQNIKVGREEMVKVISNNCEYFIPKQKIANFINCKQFEFIYTRKDLIQVENIIHVDLL